MSEARRGTVVEVKPVRDPLNRPSVLIQLEDGYVVLLPDDAWRVAIGHHDRCVGSRTHGEFMSEPDVEQVIVVPRSDPVYSVFVWRSDSVTLARLRPVLNQIRRLPDQPCQIDDTPYSCMELGGAMEMCPPCQLRQIKSVLFDTEREQP